MNSFVKNRGGISGVADVDMPREKLERLGPEALRDEELLAILLRTGYEGRNVLEISRGIIKRFSVNKLVDMDLNKLTTIKGIGRAKAAGLVAGFELAKRGLNQGMGIAPSITSPVDVLGLLTDIKDRRKEYFVALFLNAPEPGDLPRRCVGWLAQCLARASARGVCPRRGIVCGECYSGAQSSQRRCDTEPRRY